MLAWFSGPNGLGGVDRQLLGGYGGGRQETRRQARHHDGQPIYRKHNTRTWLHGRLVIIEC